VALNAVGGPTFAPALAALAPGGRMAVIATTPDRREVPLDLLDFYRRDLRLLGVNTLTLDAAAGARILEQLAPGFEAGALRKPAVAETYPLARAAEAYERVGAGAGKVVLTMG
jgi:NADPH:quinone reductase-like Zn-dependent oxidoreductase